MPTDVAPAAPAATLFYFIHVTDHHPDLFSSIVLLSPLKGELCAGRDSICSSLYLGTLPCAWPRAGAREWTCGCTGQEPRRQCCESAGVWDSTWGAVSDSLQCRGYIYQALGQAPGVRIEGGRPSFKEPKGAQRVPPGSGLPRWWKGAGSKLRS